MQKHHRLQLQTARVFPINVDAKASNVNVKIERLYRQSGRVSALSATRTNLDRVAGLYMDKPNAILVANAGNNVTLTTEQATHDETHYKKNKVTLAKQ